jgi:uncharacterized protein (TIGR02266 family)
MTQPLLQQAPDARAHNRADFEVEVSLGSDHNFYQGFSENLSEGGLFVATHSLREVGSDVSIEFSLPGRDTPIRAKAIVRWLRIYSETSDGQPGMGLQFVDLDASAIEAIRTFVASRSPLFFD